MDARRDEDARDRRKVASIGARSSERKGWERAWKGGRESVCGGSDGGAAAAAGLSCCSQAQAGGRSGERGKFRLRRPAPRRAFFSRLAGGERIFSPPALPLPPSLPQRCSRTSPRLLSVRLPDRWARPSRFPRPLRSSGRLTITSISPLALSPRPPVPTRPVALPSPPKTDPLPFPPSPGLPVLACSSSSSSALASRSRPRPGRTPPLSPVRRPRRRPRFFTRPPSRGARADGLAFLAPLPPFLPPSTRCPPLLACYASLPVAAPRRAHLLARIGRPTAASEVSSILEGRIAGSSSGGDVQETGRVLSASACLLPSAFLPPSSLTTPASPANSHR